MAFYSYIVPTDFVIGHVAIQQNAFDKDLVA